MAETKTNVTVGGGESISSSRSRLRDLEKKKKKKSNGDGLLYVVDDESEMELEKLLESETAETKVKFAADPYNSWPRVYQSSYVTINCNNDEICGSSFSDLESSVMASVDLRGIQRHHLRQKPISCPPEFNLTASDCESVGDNGTAAAAAVESYWRGEAGWMSKGRSQINDGGDDSEDRLSLNSDDIDILEKYLSEDLFC